jgi:arsenite methyltransferase
MSAPADTPTGTPADMPTPASIAPVAEMVRGLVAADASDPDVVKACCATAYGVDLVALLLGDSYHPGGADLTHRLAEALGLQPGERVIDVACGIGTTALLLAAERRVEILGIDLGEAQIGRARRRAAHAGLDGQAQFRIGDAERLPADDGAPGAGFDAAVCECALCTFPDKRTALAELDRVVRPRGRVGITDVWLDPARLDPDLRGLAGRVACIADARPIDEIRTLVEDAGLVVDRVERHDDALADTIDRVATRLRAARLLDLPVLREFDLGRGIELAHRAADAVARGDAGYMLLTATKP